MSEISPEIQTHEASANTSGERESRIHAIGSKLGALVLEGVKDTTEKIGEIVSGFYYFLSPVPKEFNFRTFKTHPDPIIKNH